MKLIRNYSIDMFKFIFSLLVIMIHIHVWGNRENSIDFWLTNLVPRLAVPFFFMCTGYFLWEKYKAETLNIKRYLIKIIRLYIIWCIIYSPIVFRDLYHNVDSLSGLVKYIVHIAHYFIVVGFYHHLWYLNAVIWSVGIVFYLVYHGMAFKKIFFISIILYCAGLLGESWAGLAEICEQIMPSLYTLFIFTGKIFVTARNGLSEGMLFICLGILVSIKGKAHSLPLSVMGGIICLALQAIELYYVKSNDMAIHYDTFIMLPFTAYFLFQTVLALSTDYHRVFPYLGPASTLIYLVHPWVIILLMFSDKLLHTHFMDFIIPFIIVLIITLIISWGILRLSNTSKFSWLRKLYS